VCVCVYWSRPNLLYFDELCYKFQSFECNISNFAFPVPTGHLEAMEAKYARKSQVPTLEKHDTTYHF